MKGIICYYSGSGNTRLTCQYIVKNVESIEFDLFDVVKDGMPDLEKYDVVGFATFTDFWGPPHLFQTFIESLPQQNSKRAFVFNTYGFISGKTLKMLDEWVTARGFQVVAGHSLHTPESYPPMIARGMGNARAPSKREMRNFDGFISALNKLLNHLQVGKEVEKKKMRIGFVNSLLPTLPRTQARKDMGEKYIDESLCMECGLCEKNCPYRAITLSPKPAFNMDECYGCWACYNHCPHESIYTSKYRGVAHYPEPIDQLREKLKI